MEEKNMTKTIVKSINYEKSDSIEFQGTKLEANKICAEKGYNIQLCRNGYWVLVKPCKINVTLSSDNLIKKFDMRLEILEYYKRSKMTVKLCETFKEDVKNEKITLTLNLDGSYTFN